MQCVVYVNNAECFVICCIIGRKSVRESHLRTCMKYFWRLDYPRNDPRLWLLIFHSMLVLIDCLSFYLSLLVILESQKTHNNWYQRGKILMVEGTRVIALKPHQANAPRQQEAMQLQLDDQQ